MQHLRKKIQKSKVDNFLKGKKYLKNFFKQKKSI